MDTLRPRVDAYDATRHDTRLPALPAKTTNSPSCTTYQLACPFLSSTESLALWTLNDVCDDTSALAQRLAGQLKPGLIRLLLPAMCVCERLWLASNGASLKVPYCASMYCSNCWTVFHYQHTFSSSRVLVFSAAQLNANHLSWDGLLDCLTSKIGSFFQETQQGCFQAYVLTAANLISLGDGGIALPLPLLLLPAVP